VHSSIDVDEQIARLHAQVNEAREEGRREERAAIVVDLRAFAEALDNLINLAEHYEMGRPLTPPTEQHGGISTSSSGCPCRFTIPCHPNCTCVQPLSSSGCQRCCSYGSPSQQRAAATRLVRRIDATLDARTVAFVRMALFAEDYAKADDRRAQQNKVSHVPDELTAQDVADGYREGYQRLHRLVSALWAAAEQLPPDLLTAARLHEVTPLPPVTTGPKHG
jgi:hypothetical protein